MIASFGDRTTEDIFHGLDSKAAWRIKRQLWPVIVRKLDMLNAARDLRDLSAPLGNRVKALKHELRGFYSIRVNDPYRIVFQWSSGHADAVKVADYH